MANAAARRIVTSPSTPRTLTREEIDEIAKAAVAHVRSVERRLCGLIVKGGVAARIDRELAKRGYRTGEQAG